ncbi:MAG: ATP-binding protein [Brumimicrobium sp.]|nr:ATP-binding protein [Brumimicrobium sp.]MCO5267725.1 ATP-binding protein [Brumimicrobium sp.]
MKIVFTGPESSGKTQLSQAIAKQFNAQWFPEYAREYLLARGGKYDVDDIEKIAVEQDDLRRSNEESGLKVYDTENIVFYIWSQFKYQRSSETIVKLMTEQQFDYYFLCDPTDIPWEDDPLREHPNQREELFTLYLDQLRLLNVPFTILSGNFKERMDVVIKVVEGILK